MDLTSIALEAGFCSHAHFTGAFRKEFGFPPSYFQKRGTISLVREMSRKLEA